jgi:hypothetical protein
MNNPGAIAFLAMMAFLFLAGNWQRQAPLVIQPDGIVTFENDPVQEATGEPLPQDEFLAICAESGGTLITDNGGLICKPNETEGLAQSP